MDQPSVEAIVQARDLDTMKLHPGIAAPAGHGRSALMHAAEAGWSEAVIYIAQHHPRTVSEANLRGWTPLMHAAKASLPCVRALLAAGAPINDTNTRGWSSLMQAAEAGRADVVELLLTNGAEIDQPNRCGWTALMAAAFAGHSDVVDVLVDAGAQTELIDRDNRTALHYAAMVGAARAVVRLAACAGFDTLDTKERTPLHYAIEAEGAGAPAAVGLLFGTGPEQTADLSGQTPADVALAQPVGWPAAVAAAIAGDWVCVLAYHGCAAALAAAIERGADTQQRVRGRRALVYAALGNSAEAVNTLLRASRTPERLIDTRGQAGETALAAGARVNATDAVRALLAAGADHTIAADAGTPLELAARAGAAETVEVLLEAGANVTEKVMKAAKSRHMKNILRQALGEPPI